MIPICNDAISEFKKIEKNKKISTITYSNTILV